MSTQRTASLAGRPGAMSRSAPRRGLLVFALALATSTGTLQQSAVIPLLPRLEQSLHASVSAVSWVLTVSLLCGAVATPLFGRLGDMYGRRRMLLVSLGLLVAGSVVGALSASIATLMVARVLQGLSGAILPLAVGAVRDLLPRDKAATGIGVLSATMGIGAGVGMIFSGLIAEYTTGYRVVFWVIAALAAAAPARPAGARRPGAPP
ncbi:MAG: MFS transporter, partial [Actinomadura rubrobrunea]|nr:MFS transporter [Actinomadura rubrobrunea]